jgi:hypothetical protein
MVAVSDGKKESYGYDYAPRLRNFVCGPSRVYTTQRHYHLSRTFNGRRVHDALSQF